MSVSLSPVFQDAQLDGQGNPASGHKVWIARAGTSTPAVAFTTIDGDVPHSNPIILNPRGEPSDFLTGVSTPIWLTDGELFDMYLVLPSVTVFPPSSVIRIFRDVSGVGSTEVGGTPTPPSISEWDPPTGLTPTFLSPTTFSLPGNQTAAHHVGRRIRATIAGGKIYGTITLSIFTTVTTITVLWDQVGSALDSSLTRIDLGIISFVNTSVPSFSGMDLLEIRTLTAVNLTTFALTAKQLADYKSFHFRLGPPLTLAGPGGGSTTLSAAFSSNGGTSFDSGATDYDVRREVHDIGAATAVQLTGSGTSLINLATNMIAAREIYAEIDFLPSTGYLKSESMTIATAGDASKVWALGKPGQNAIRFSLGSGTLTGKITLLGIR